MRLKTYSGEASDSSYPPVPLDQYPCGPAARVFSVVGGHGMLLRLAQRGIREGAVVRRLPHGPRRGPVMVEVNGCRVALGRGIARKVLVVPCP
ncbi:MAG: FeoA family protein [Candidatus Bipolaricaulota bacterium]